VVFGYVIVGTNGFYESYSVLYRNTVVQYNMLYHKLYSKSQNVKVYSKPTEVVNNAY